VKSDDVRVRGEQLNDLGLSKEASGVQGVSAGSYGYLVDRFNGVGLAGVRRGASVNGTESSPADLLRNDVVLLEVFTHTVSYFTCFTGKIYEERGLFYKVDCWSRIFDYGVIYIFLLYQIIIFYFAIGLY